MLSSYSSNAVQTVLLNVDIPRANSLPKRLKCIDHGLRTRRARTLRRRDLPCHTAALRVRHHSAREIRLTMFSNGMLLFNFNP